MWLPRNVLTTHSLSLSGSRTTDQSLTQRPWSEPRRLPALPPRPRGQAAQCWGQNQEPRKVPRWGLAVQTLNQEPRKAPRWGLVVQTLTLTHTTPGPSAGTDLGRGSRPSQHHDPGQEAHSQRRFHPAGASSPHPPCMGPAPPKPGAQMLSTQGVLSFHTRLGAIPLGMFPALAASES